MHIERSGRRGFTFTDLVVVLAVIAFLLALVPVTSRLANERANRIRCATNLKEIGQGFELYAGNNMTAYPRTAYDTTRPPGAAFDGSGASASGFDQVPANNVSAALFLLIRETKLGPAQFVCPSAGHTPDPAATAGTQTRWNFSGPDNLSYSIVNPYPTQTAVSHGVRYSATGNPGGVLAADRNTGIGDATATPDSPEDVLRMHNSTNHGREGQNVLYGDGHVEWQTTPWCGAGHDHIYARAKVVKTGEPGSVFEYGLTNPPAIGPNGFPDPACGVDTVLLPVFAPQTAGAVGAPGIKLATAIVAAAVLGLVVIVALVVVVLMVRTRSGRTSAGGPPTQPPPMQG